MDTEKKQQVDQGWAWVIVSTNVLTMMIQGGLLYCVGIFNVVFLGVFQESSAMTAWIGSLTLGIQYLTGPVSSAIVGRFGWRAACISGSVIAGLGLFLGCWATHIVHLCLTFGLMLGFGVGMVYIASTVVIGHYTQNNRVLAYGAAACGVSIGTIIFPLVVDWLLVQFSWRETLALLGCICLQCCVCGALWRPLSQPPDVSEALNTDTRTQSDKPRHQSRHLIRKLCPLTFLLYCVSLLMDSTGEAIVYLHLAAFTVTQGASGQEAAAYISIIGLSGLVGRGLTGLAGNDTSIDRLLLFLGSQGILATCTLCLPLIVSVFYMRVLYATLFGIHCGVIAVVMAPVTIELVGVEHLNAAFGLELVVCGVGSLAGPPVAGGCFLAGAFAAMLIPIAAPRQKSCKQDQTEQVEDIEMSIAHVQEACF